VRGRGTSETNLTPAKARRTPRKITLNYSLKVFYLRNSSAHAIRRSVARTLLCRN
jgi:hypothetical protein